MFLSVYHNFIRRGNSYKDALTTLSEIFSIGILTTDNFYQMPKIYSWRDKAKFYVCDILTYDYLDIDCSIADPFLFYHTNEYERFAKLKSDCLIDDKKFIQQLKIKRPQTK
ncbi:MAG: hypothetical protein LBF22_05280 [Deltaproteobacteria bacterium]|jgi:hypothetical protein|nr:hypothetical protein [Deltaproteobacteria bacterium]